MAFCTLREAKGMDIKMKRLEDIIHVLDTKIVSGEKYYTLNDLQECLNGLNDEMIEAEDYILTPYYIFMGKRMELYEYELTIVADKKQSFEEYLLNITGKQTHIVPAQSV